VSALLNYNNCGHFCSACRVQAVLDRSSPHDALPDPSTHIPDLLSSMSQPVKLDPLLFAARREIFSGFVFAVSSGSLQVFHPFPTPSIGGHFWSWHWCTILHLALVGNSIPSIGGQFYTGHWWTILYLTLEDKFTLGIAGQDYTWHWWVAPSAMPGRLLLVVVAELPPHITVSISLSLALSLSFPLSLPPSP
jgi:hypothetical protein